jgi:hypothetical protein
MQQMDFNKIAKIIKIQISSIKNKMGFTFLMTIFANCESREEKINKIPYLERIIHLEQLIDSEIKEK